eukprot:746816-Hanusia_phi.AAC.6
MGKSEEEAFYFWRMLDALTGPLELAIALRRSSRWQDKGREGGEVFRRMGEGRDGGRHATLHDVDAVVELARYTIARCELLVDRDGEVRKMLPTSKSRCNFQYQGLPDDDSTGAWKEWLNGKKDGVSRSAVTLHLVCIIVPVRLQIMRELLPKLQMSHQALTLALTTLRIKVGDPSAFCPDG